MGEKKDVPALLGLIRELAIFEKAEGQVEVGVAELEKDGFGPQPLFGFFVADTGREIAGIALYYWKYSTWKGRCLFLEDLIVQEKFRGHGIGSKLFEQVIRMAREEGVRRLEWQVLDWNQPAITFYKKHSAVLDNEWINGKLTYDQLQAYQLTV